MLSFKGGINPPEKKELTADKPIEKADVPDKVVIPLKQHAGAPAKPIVQVGDEVNLGQRIAEPEGLGAYIHSSVSGKVKEIKEIESSIFGKIPAVVIENNKKDEPHLLEEKEPIEMIEDAGIVGMGGAMFPTHIKLLPPREKEIDTLIINGAECEPYLTCDYRLMVEKPDEIMEGIKILTQILNVTETIIGVERNKRKAAEKLRDVQLLKTKYPEGAEKTLIKVLLNREVPPNGLPFDVGVVVTNIGTVYAIKQAVKEKKSLVERVVTVSGAVKEPKNLLVRIGTPVKELIRQCHGYVGKPEKVIHGGPMMGICIKEDEPIMKGTSGIVVMNTKMVDEEKPCIRCSECVNVCPMNLMPKFIADNVKAEKYEALDSLNISDCFECGACAYVCPSFIPLVKYIKEGKCKK